MEIGDEVVCKQPRDCPKLLLSIWKLKINLFLQTFQKTAVGIFSSAWLWPTSGILAMGCGRVFEACKMLSHNLVLLLVMYLILILCWCLCCFTWKREVGAWNPWPGRLATGSGEAESRPKNFPQVPPTAPPLSLPTTPPPRYVNDKYQVLWRNFFTNPTPPLKMISTHKLFNKFSRLRNF